MSKRRLDSSLVEAAHRAADAVAAVTKKYRAHQVTDEEDITGVLVGRLDQTLQGTIGNLHWSTSVVRHHSGVAAEEDRIGADLVIHVELTSRDLSYSKGVLVQSKRIEAAVTLKGAKADSLFDQCEKMLSITPAAFVFDYATKGMRCASATSVLGAPNVPLYETCVWTPYRFFLELFRCPIGDPRLTSALVEDLPAPTLVKLAARG